MAGAAMNGLHPMVEQLRKEVETCVYGYAPETYNILAFELMQIFTARLGPILTAGEKLRPFTDAAEAVDDGTCDRVKEEYDMAWVKLMGRPT